MDRACGSPMLAIPTPHHIIPTSGLVCADLGNDGLEKELPGMTILLKEWTNPPKLMETRVRGKSSFERLHLKIWVTKITEHITLPETNIVIAPKKSSPWKRRFLLETTNF